MSRKRGEASAVKMDVDLHAADVDEARPLRLRRRKPRHRLAQRLRMHFAPVDVHVIGAKLAPVAGFGEADRIETSSGTPLARRRQRHRALAGERPGEGWAEKDEKRRGEPHSDRSRRLRRLAAGLRRRRLSIRRHRPSHRSRPSAR